MKSFEERLTRLEELSEKIKGGDLPLEDAVAMFEEGMVLAKGLEKELSKIERKVEILLNKPKDESEKPELDLFPEIEDDQS
jgi:exodeoxyribonuclease VII small subunit